jgi:hypothetical protein
MEQEVECLPVLQEGTWARRPLLSGSTWRIAPYHNMDRHEEAAPSNRFIYTTHYMI